MLLYRTCAFLLILSHVCEKVSVYALILVCKLAIFSRVIEKETLILNFTLKYLVGSAKCRREQRFLECECVSRIAKAIMISREKPLRAAYNSAPGTLLKVERTIQNVPPTPAAARAYNGIVDEIGLDGPPSDDDNYPEGPPAQLSRKQKRQLSGIQRGASSPGAEPRIHSTSSSRGGNLDHPVGPGGTIPLTEECYKQMLTLFKKRCLEEAEHPDLDIADIKLKNICARTQLSVSQRRTITQNKLINGSFVGQIPVVPQPR